MLYLGYLIHALLMFISPLIYLDYRSSLKAKAIFTVIYTLSIILFRGLYEFLPIPFGTHTILLIISHMILVTILIKEINWTKALSIALILMIIMLINDTLVVVPFMKHFGITLNDIETNGLLGFFVSAVVSNLLLIVSYGIGTLKSRKKQAYNL